MLITEQRAVTLSIQAPSGLGIESRANSSQTPRIQLQQESRVVVHPYIYVVIPHLRRTHAIHLIPNLSIDLITSWETIVQLFLSSSSSSPFFIASYYFSLFFLSVFAFNSPNYFLLSRLFFSHQSCPLSFQPLLSIVH